MSSVTRYIVLSRVGVEGGFSDVIGVCKTLYDAQVSRDVDRDTYGTDESDYNIVEWDFQKN